MVKQLFLNKLIVKKSSTHGYGVFAAKHIKKGELLEHCYFILTKGGDNVLDDFYFDAKGKNAVFLGFGSIYNHSDDPNADYKLNIKKRVATIKAVRSIPKGEEIFVTYGDDWFSSRGLTFKKPKKKNKKAKAKKLSKKRK